jgi:Rrf2 family transcriptional regulator, cysteine metabolism repressor
MKISSKGEYGIRALFDLAQHYEKGSRRSREISKAQGLQEPYLNQLLIKLRTAGLIDSLRGPQGGHVLARPPQQITLYEIIKELEGDISPVAHDVKPVPLSELLDEVWQQIEDYTRRVLQETTLETLVERYTQRYEAIEPQMYYI